MENAQKIYTNKAISIATFFGGPIAAGILIGHNYKIFGDDDKQRYSVIIGIISTLIFFELLFLIPDRIMNSIPNALIPAIYTGIIYVIVHKTQDDRINESIQNGVEETSKWKAAGIGLLCSILIIGYILIRAYNMPVFEGEVMTFGTAEHEIYYHEGIPYSDVKKEGDELTKYGYFKTQDKQSVQFTIENNSYILKINVPKEWWEDKDILESLESLRTQISNSLNRNDINKNA
jgi:predicted membrane protein